MDGVLKVNGAMMFYTGTRTYVGSLGYETGSNWSSGIGMTCADNNYICCINKKTTAPTTPGGVKMVAKSSAAQVYALADGNAAMIGDNAILLEAPSILLIGTATLNGYRILTTQDL